MEGKAIAWLGKVNNKLERFFGWLDGHSRIFLLSMFFITLGVRLLSTNFASLLQKDAFIYLLQALDMIHGNFVPSASQSVGLSLFAAPFLMIFGTASIFHNMVVARTISCVFGSLIIFPLYLLAGELLEKRARLAALVLFVLQSALIINASEFLTETLFTFFFLFALYYAVVYIKRKNQSSGAPGESHQTDRLFSRVNQPLFLSFLFAGLSYYMRPNGIFVLAILVIAYLFAGRKQLSKIWWPLLIGFLIFWATAAPFLVQRYVVFGSPFTYGENDKLWVDNYAQVWSSNLKPPSALSYFKSHTPKEIFNRFAVRGAGRVVYDLLRPKDFPLLLFFLLLGAGLNLFRKEYQPLFISLLVFWGGLSIVYDIFYAGRYVLPLFPVLFIFIGAGLWEVFKAYRWKEALLAVFIICYICLSVVAISKAQEPTATMPAWAVWAAQNIRGRMSVIEGGDLIIMNLPDATTAGVGQKDIYAPKSGLSVFRPGYFIDLPQAMAYFKTTGVTHILFDDNNRSMHWYLLEIPDHPSWFKKVYDNASSTDPWKVTMFKIQWDEYDKSVKK